ncbi:MAG: response regulator transcription factor [Eubacteriales bacterium]|nr:response regulator transcription factor [Eubacteriales bacterium]
MEEKIMLIDDDVKLLKQLSAHLKKEGYRVQVYLEGSSALQEFSSWSPSLVLLNMTLPQIDSYNVCKELRRVSNVPILILAQSDSPEDKIRMLDCGADDYMVKPVHLGELSARIRVHLRRFENPAERSSVRDTDAVVAYPDLIINLTNYSVIYEGQKIAMPPKELELLYCLASSPNRVFTREQLLDLVWGYDYVGDARTVDVHIKRIRQKIRDHASWSLTTVWGVGYKFSAD